MFDELKRLRARVKELEQRETELKLTEEALEERLRLAVLIREVSLALIQSSSLQESLQHCTQALVDQLGAAFARIWTFNSETQMLELQASAGLYTHLDGPHSRVPLGSFKIGLIAAERVPHLTNEVVGDPRVSDQEWAQREGMVAFAGYPLLIEEKVVGVIALFARIALSQAVIDALASIANAVALGIQRKQLEEDRQRSLQINQEARERAEATELRLRSILDNLPDGFMIFDEEWRYSYFNVHAHPYTGKPWTHLLGKNVWEEFPALVGTLYHQQYHRAIERQEPVFFELYSQYLAIWVDIRAYPIPGGLAVYFRDISERKHAEEERTRLLQKAEQARIEAVEALQLRNDFISSISHDLKTPLTTIKGSVQLLQRKIAREQSIEPLWLSQRLALIQSSTSKMTSMVEDLLDLAKMQAGQQLDLEVRPVPLMALAQQVSSEQQETSKRHTIIVTGPSEELVVNGDAIRLDRVLTNLLSNAIKYSPAGGEITVEVRQEEDQSQRPWVVLAIHDQGVGIPEKDLPHIFNPFHRAGNVTGRIQGTGVGLASVVQVVEQHGGEVAVSSEEGRGSTFTVKLPLSA